MPNELSESQAADVLRRAALLQAGGESGRDVGLSLDEVKHAAEAAGIDARFVDQAYLGGGDAPARSEPFLGIETGVQRVRVVPGHVSEPEWGRMVLALRREFGSDGEAETLGDSRAWKAYQARVQLEPDGPNTRITATNEWASDAKVPLYASVFYAVTAALIVGGAALTGGTVVWGLAALLLVVAVLHAGYVAGPVRKRARTRGPQLDRALDAIERLAGTDERAAALADDPLTSPTKTSGGSSPAPLLSPSLLDESLPDLASPTNAERTRLRG